MANKSLKLTLRNERVEALERRVGLVEKILNDNTCAMRDGLLQLANEINGLKTNELEHIYAKMESMEKAQGAIKEFQAALQGSIRTAKWIIGLAWPILIVLIQKLLNTVWK